MANIKISELRRVLRENEQEDIKTVDYHGLPIEIKQYIPISDKITLIRSIYESALDVEGGLHIVNDNSVDIAFRVLLVETYSNLTLPQMKNEENKMTINTIEAYDMLCQSGLYDFVYNNIPAREVEDLKMALYNHIKTEYERYKQMNTVQYIVKELLNELVDKIPTKEEAEEFVKETQKTMETFDKDNLKFLKDFQMWNNGVEK